YLTHAISPVIKEYHTQGNVQNKGYTKTLVSTSMGTQIIRVHTQGYSLFIFPGVGPVFTVSLKNNCLFQAVFFTYP
ncbi:MAG: hypothetical protein II847_05105, partial [Ruminobacter sp.]|uniref:hypothetical protein n=1 Tax=Ruminobacter sp. TaxID=2774296 RepID=UPI002580C670